jgi:hypothetical protein
MRIRGDLIVANAGSSHGKPAAFHLLALHIGHLLTGEVFLDGDL